MALANMADAGKTTLVVAITLVIGLLCLIGSVLGFYHESSKDKFLQIDDASSKIFPFKTDPDIPSNSMLTSTKGQKGEKGDRGPMGKTVRGPMGPPGPPGPPGGSYYSSETSSTSCASPNLRNAEPLACPASVTSFDLLPTASVEAGTLVYLRDENKLVLKTASTWVELQAQPRPFYTPQEPPASTKSSLSWVEETTTRESVANTPSWRPPPPAPRYNDKVRLIALNDRWSGRLGGVQGADLLCQRDADRSNVDGNFRAFLPSVSHTASVDHDMVKTILSPPFPFMSASPISNIRGQILFNSWDHMLETGGQVSSGASIYSFDGKNIGNGRNTIWHGVNPWGEKSHYNCEDWSSDNPLHVGLASSLEGGLIAKQKKHSCNNKFHILCIEI